MDTELIDHGSWAELVLNRPERKNAINGPLGRDLSRALADIEKSEHIQAVLFRGAGGAFCSGLDLKEFNAEPAPDWLPDFQHIWRDAHRGLMSCSKPIVGALERYAINGGAALALACDLLIAGERSAGDISAQFPVSAAAISQHLKVLREAHLVQVRVEAQKRIYTIDPKGFTEMDAWIGRTRIFWQDRLGRLEEALLAQKAKAPRAKKPQGKGRRK